ncbi:hypothetical protein [Streptosporangium sp. NPDC087985]|uniref:COG4315 family predicted lipoprotein n=1 Tax=Streptosporangium sp. NPDC087985 TaxID=3366196 RepID=UPI0037F19EF7
MRKLLHAGVLALSLSVAGCGSASEGGAADLVAADQAHASLTPYATPTESGTPSGSPTESGMPSGRAMVELGDTKIGKVLVGEEGRTLYLFKKDKDGKSSCSDACAMVWPPYLTEGKPEAGNGVKADLLDTIKREDGKTQVTYNHHPLYYYVKDKKAGDTTGNDIESFGAEWYAVTAEGKKVG